MAAAASATKRSIQSSPRKMRLMLDMIRGKRVTDALATLHFTPNHASIVAEKTLRSAIANFQQKPENSRYDVEDLYVRQCWADGGPMLKRISAAPMGRAFRIRKRSNHLTIIVANEPMPGTKKDRKGRKADELKMAPKAAKPTAASATAPAAAPAKKTRAKKAVSATA